MLYSYFGKTQIRQSFDHVNNDRWDELLKPVAPNILDEGLAVAHHRVCAVPARRKNP